MWPHWLHFCSRILHTDIFIAIVKKEIYMQNMRDAKQQFGIETTLLEDFIHIGSVTIQFFRQPGYTTFLTAKFFFYYLADVYHDIKKAEPFETYFILRNRQVPCVQISTNSSRPART